MNNTSSTPVDNIKRFWDSYIFLLRKQEIKPSNERWYLLRAEQYIKAYPDLRLTQHQPEQVTTYLTKIGQNPRLLDWQYSQTINAIQSLFILVKSSWVNEFDWSFWIQSSESLPTNHATIVREPSDPDPSTSAIKQTIEKKHKNFKATKKKHDSVLTKFIFEVRRRAYSIRTEQAYMNWIVRFFAFTDPKEFSALSAEEVSLFLENLAVKRNVAASTQNQALNALAFLFNEVMKKPLGELKAFTRAQTPKRLPVVLTRTEVNQLLEKMQGTQ